MRAYIYLILALLLALLVTIFAVQNNAAVDVSFLVWRAEGSMALVLMITFAVGILIGLLVSAPAYIRSRLKTTEIKRTLRKVEADQAAAPQTAPSPEPEPPPKPGKDAAQSIEDDPKSEQP